MRNFKAIALLLICVLATSGFGSCGKVVKPDPVPPAKLPPIPASLKTRTDYVSQVRAELLESSPPAKPSATPF